MVVYLTYNDAPSGIFSSQVIDVVKFGSQKLKKEVLLVSFISIRQFSKNRKLIKDQLPKAIVLPMVPRVRNWKGNSFLLSAICLVIKPKTIIGRSVLATKLALIVKKRNLCENVIYDGRGAIAAEWSEYNVIDEPVLLDKIENYEKEVITKSDYRIAVSKALSDYWKRHFNYAGSEFVNIPCTISLAFENLTISSENITAKRRSFNYGDNDIVLIYSGSHAGWQSFKLLDDFLTELLPANANYKVLFISKEDKHISALKERFNSQVQCISLSPNDVPEVLQIGDYGILIRENSITNLVASPVKYAEYLACGLKVIISEQLGDYSEFTLKNSCGLLFSDVKSFERISMAEKLRLQKIAHANFIKDCFSEDYLRVFS